MTYETGSANDLEDLLSKLDTFAVTTHGGWTRGYTSNPQTTDGWFELHKGSLSVSMKYPVGAQAPPVNMSVHQASGYIGTSTAPGAHTNDSGSGYNSGTTGHTNANLLTERCISDIGDGPYPSYHFFADDSAPNDYIHCVIEVSTGMYRHLSFGKLLTVGDNWTGGEYVCGHYQNTTASSTSTATTVLLDGLFSTTGARRGATVRIASGLANQSPAIWAVSAALPTASVSTDTAGNVRRQVHGGYRCGLAVRGFGSIIGSSSLGVVGLIPIELYYRDPSNARVYLLGEMPDVAQLNIRNYAPGQEVTNDSDTWVVFPQSLRSTANVTNASNFAGIAYKKVV